MKGRDGILYETEDSALGAATFSVISTENWAVSNVGLFLKDIAHRLWKIPHRFWKIPLQQVTGTDVTPELFQTSRASSRITEILWPGP